MLECRSGEPLGGGTNRRGLAVCRDVRIQGEAPHCILNRDGKGAVRREQRTCRRFFPSAGDFRKRHGRNDRGRRWLADQIARSAIDLGNMVALLLEEDEEGRRDLKRTEALHRRRELRIALRRALLQDLGYAEELGQIAWPDLRFLD